MHPGDLAGEFSDLEMTCLLYCAGAATGYRRECLTTRAGVQRELRADDGGRATETATGRGDRVTLGHAAIAFQGETASVASCLINAQPLPAHSPDAYDNILIGCTSHNLTDDWSLASTHFVDISVLVWVRSFIELDVLKTMYRSTIPLRFI